MPTDLAVVLKLDTYVPRELSEYSATVLTNVFPALSLTVKAPLSAPEAVGVKVMLIAQLELAAKGVEQLLVSAKFPVT